MTFFLEEDSADAASSDIVADTVVVIPSVDNTVLKLLLFKLN